MGEGPRYRVAFRRRREGRTDYRRRLALVKSGEHRMVVRKTLRNVTVQLVRYDETGDVVAAQAQATELADHGWTGYTENAPAAYLTGLLAAKRAKEAGVEKAILDIGRRPPVAGSNVFAALAGALDGGLKIPHGDGVLPHGTRLRGDHLGKPEAVQAFESARAKIAPGAPPLKLEAKKKDKKKEAPAPAPAKGKQPGKPAAPKAPKAEGAKPEGEKKKEKPKKEGE